MAATAVVSGADTGALKERALVPTLVLVGLVVAVMSSLGAPLIPTISAASHVSLSAGEWLLTITLLTGALATPVMGRLADGPHQRRVILTALGVVLVGLVLAATSSSFPVLVAARGLQGVGVGLMPVTMAVARRQLATEKAAKTIAMLSVTAAVGVGLGYPITGLLAEVSDYHASFWFGAAVVIAGLVLSAIVLPRSTTTISSRRFDTIGATLLCIALAIFIVVLSEAETWGWLSARVLILLAASVVLAAAWARYELRRHDPLVDLRQARNRMVLTADIAGLIISLTMYLFLPIVVEFVQIPSSNGFGFGASVLVSGFVLVPLSIGTLGASRLAPYFERRYGRRIMIPLGAVLFAVSMGVFAIEHSGLWEAFLVMGIAGVGIGFTFAAMPGFIVKAVHAKDTGSAMGFYQVLRSIGLAIGSAVSGVILAAYTRPHHDFPGVGGFRMALLLGAVLCLITAVLCYFLPGRSLSAEAHPVDAEELIAMEENAELGGSGLMLADAAGEGQAR
jgi:MFS family permease